MCGKFLCASVLFAAIAGPARADVMFQTGNIPQKDENVLFNDKDLVSSGSIVQGQLNQSHAVVDFLGSEPLNTPSLGQARIVADDGLFTGLAIQLNDPNATFKSLIFNIHASTDGSVVFTATNQLGNVITSPTFALDGNGENYFTITTDALQSLKSVNIASTVLSQSSHKHTSTIPDEDIVDLEQVRIGGVASTVPTHSVVAAPLPSAGLCTLALLVPLGLIRRRY